MYVYFDIGGTKTRVATSTDETTFTEPVKFATPRDLDALFEEIERVARELGGDDTIEAAGGGIACPVDRTNHALGWAPNLPEEWTQRSFVDELGTKLGCPVYIDNDTAVIGVGEAHHGSGQGYEVMVYITISTGVGGARIVNGSSASIGMSAEPGRQYIDISKQACANCDSGNAQLMLSGANMERRYGVKPYEVTDPEVWEEMSLWAAYMLANTTVHWAPDCIVLGGSMITGDPAIAVDRIAAHLKDVLVFPKVPELRQAALGDFGGIYGAMEFVRQRHTGA